MENRISEALSLRGMKKIELAEKTGISKATISHWNNQKYQPKQDNLMKLAKALDVSEMWLAGYDVPMENEIKIINRIIFESIRHGADPGGSYDCNAKNLIESVEEWLKLKGLQNDYTIEEQEVNAKCNYNDTYEIWRVFQIVKK